MTPCVFVLLTLLALVCLVIADTGVTLTTTRITPETTLVVFTAVTNSTQMSSIAEGDRYKLTVDSSLLKITEAEEARTIRSWGSSFTSTRTDVNKVSVSNNVIDRKLEVLMKLSFYSDARLQFFAKVKDLKDVTGGVTVSYTHGDTTYRDTAQVSLYPSLAKSVKLTLDFDKLETFDKRAQFFFSTSLLNYDLPNGLKITIEKPYYWYAANSFSCLNNGAPLKIIRDSSQVLRIPSALRADDTLNIACNDVAMIGTESFMDFSSSYLFTTEGAIESNTLPAVFDGVIPRKPVDGGSWFESTEFIVVCVVICVIIIAGAVFWRVKMRNTSSTSTSLFSGVFASSGAPAQNTRGEDGVSVEPYSRMQ